MTVDVAKRPPGKTSVTASSPASAGLSGRSSLGATDGVTDAGACDGEGDAGAAAGVAVAPATPPVGLGVLDAEQAASETTHATAAMRDTNRRAGIEGLQSLTASPRTAPAPPGTSRRLGGGVGDDLAPSAEPQIERRRDEQVQQGRRHETAEDHDRHRVLDLVPGKVTGDREWDQGEARRQSG